MILFLLACAGGGDMERYLVAAQHPEQVGLCEAIRDVGLRAECVGMAALEQARQGKAEAAGEACEQRLEGAARDECLFLVADGARMQGDRALAWCERTRGYRQQCVGHAISRDVAAVFGELGPGREREAQHRVTEVVGAYISGPEVSRKARRLMVQHLASRDPGGVFSRQVCGEADDALCRDAYVERVRLDTRSVGSSVEPWRAACANPVSHARARQIGAPDWTDDIDPIVQQGWRRLCER